MENKLEVFRKLSQIDVSGFTKEKSGLTYLSWAHAWREACILYGVDYTIWKDEMHRPYVFDPNLGYMVFTTVTIECDTKEMWLFVMDGANKAMKNEPYTYKVTDWAATNKKRDEAKRGGMSDREAKSITIFKDKTCEAASMFDINTTIMRCLVKNLAMFGLGINIYAGEDLPREILPSEEEAVEEVKECKTKEEVNATWGKYPKYQSQGSAFYIAIASKNKELAEPKAAPAKEKVTEEKPVKKSTEVEPETKPEPIKPKTETEKPNAKVEKPAVKVTKAKAEETKVDKKPEKNISSNTETTPETKPSPVDDTKTKTATDLKAAAGLISQALLEIRDCTTLKALTSIWNKYKQFREIAQFKNAVANKTKDLKKK